MDIVAIREIAVILIVIMMCKYSFKFLDTIFTARLKSIDNKFNKQLLQDYEILLNSYKELRKHNRIMSIYCLSHIYTIELDNENYEKCKELVKLIEDLKKEEESEQN